MQTDTTQVLIQAQLMDTTTIDTITTTTMMAMAMAITHQTNIIITTVAITVIMAIMVIMDITTTTAMVVNVSSDYHTAKQHIHNNTTLMDMFIKASFNYM